MNKIFKFLLLILITIMVVACTNSPRKESKEFRNYNISKDQMVDVVVSSIRDLDYKLNNIDRNEGLINFETGLSMKSWAGQAMSVYIDSSVPNGVNVYISGVRKSGAIKQVYDWGEAKGIATKIFEKIEMKIK